MKRFFVITYCALFACAVAMAGSEDSHPEVVHIPQVYAATNAAAPATNGVTTNELKLTGWVQGIIIDIGGPTSPDLDIDILTVGGTGSGPSRTLYTTDDLTADTGYVALGKEIVTSAGVALTNTAACEPLCSDQLVIKAYDCDSNNVTVDAYIIITR